jgi:hypothetical protein
MQILQLFIIKLLIYEDISEFRLRFNVLTVSSVHLTFALRFSLILAILSYRLPFLKLSGQP